MRILILHSRYGSGPVSGENRVVADEATLLRSAGHEVTVWEPEPDVRGARMLATATSAVWAAGAAREVRRLVRDTGAEVAHCHNLFPELSPAVLRAAASAGARVVMTLHNYRLLCLPADLVRDGRICEDCVGKAPWRGVAHACYRGSVAGSAVLATSLVLHRAVRSFASVSRFLAVSRFLRDKHVGAGMAAERVEYKPNFAWPATRREGPGRYFLYLGRLSPEKGCSTLLEAWRSVPAPLVVVGSGPMADELRAAAPPNVEFRGPVPAADVPGILAGARALVFPSVWFEGQPRGILEAYAAGVPVVSSRIGGLPELVEEGVTGIHVRPGDAGDLNRAVGALLDDDESERLGENAWSRWQADFSPERGLDLLVAAYRRALAPDAAV